MRVPGIRELLAAAICILAFPANSNAQAVNGVVKDAGDQAVSGAALRTSPP
jgi:hypothetical protein